MATIQELATLLASQKGLQLNTVFTEMVKSRVKQWRGRLIRNALEKNPAERIYFRQRLLFATELVPAVSCGLALDCNILRSAIPIPLPIRANNILYDYVGGPTGMVSLKRVNSWEIPYYMGDEYATRTNIGIYTEVNQRLVFPGLKLLPIGAVDGIFPDPEVISNLNCQATGEPCDFLNEDFPISEDIAQLIVQSITETDFRAMSGDADEDIDLNPTANAPESTRSR